MPHIHDHDILAQAFMLVLCLLFYFENLCCSTAVTSLAAHCHSEVTSLPNPYHSEATSLVRTRWPEATRPVGEEMKFCYCGGMYDGGQCQRDDCPRASLGYGSWHVALPKLQKLWIQGRLDDSYPELNLNDLQNHVKRTGQRRHERERDWRTATEGNVARTETGVQPRKSEVHLSESEKSHLRSIISGQEEQPKCHLFSGSERSENKRTWRKPKAARRSPSECGEFKLWR